jgi:hypothetical protein
MQQAVRCDQFYLSGSYDDLRDLNDLMEDEEDEEDDDEDMEIEEDEDILLQTPNPTDPLGEN